MDLQAGLTHGYTDYLTFCWQQAAKSVHPYQNPSRARSMPPESLLSRDSHQPYIPYSRTVSNMASRFSTGVLAWTL